MAGRSMILAEERDYLDLDDEEEILKAATEIRQRRIAERGAA